MPRKNIGEGQRESFTLGNPSILPQRQSTRLAKYNGLAIHRRVLNRLEEFVLHSPFQWVTNQSV
jgi:hypothetical protein